MNDPSTATATATGSALGEALRHIRLSGIFYCPSELTEPWGLELPAMEHCLWFHVVTTGTCTVEVDGHEPRSVDTGDLVLVPHGTGHRAWGATPAPTPSVLDLPHDEMSEQYAVLRHGGGGELTQVVCGGVRFAHPAARHLVEALPPIVHVRAARTPCSDWMHALLGLIADETRGVRPGSGAVVSRLCDVIVIQAIRSWIETDPAARTGWLGALRDEQIGAAIARIHARPERAWSVAELATTVGMSRSAFAARFTDMVGEPVMRYVTRWRVYHALDLLESTDLTVPAVAARVGYESDAAFSRAFKRVVGASPGATARTLRGADGVAGRSALLASV